jgi:hypothetical protein
MRSIALLVLACTVACTGTDVGNPPRGGLSTFDTPGCKTIATGDKGTQPPARVWLPDPATYGGLQCFLWDTTEEGKLRVRVTNYGAGCSSDEGWQPRAIERGAQEVDLLLESPECLSASCGWCIYDLLFELDAKWAQQPELTLNLLQDPDCSDRPRRDSADLPLASKPSGAVCNYANPYALEDWAEKREQSGMERMPCAYTACMAGLTCSAVESAGKYQMLKLCLASCTTDADCSAQGLMQCKAGTCQLADPR